MDLAIAVLQVSAAIATVVTLALAFVTLRGARNERAEERAHRSEERRMRRLEQLERLTLIVHAIKETVPHKAVVNRESHQRRLSAAVRSATWASLPKTRELADLPASTHSEQVGVVAGQSLDELESAARSIVAA